MLGFRSRLSNQWQKIMGESPNLVHQKGDPYRTKGAQLRYCKNAIFQGFAERRTGALFNRKLALHRALFVVRASPHRWV
jgi:hypothetical protein